MSTANARQFDFAAWQTMRAERFKCFAGKALPSLGHCRRWGRVLVLLGICLAAVPALQAAEDSPPGTSSPAATVEEGPSADEGPGAEPPKAAGKSADLATTEQQLAERYRHLEEALLRMAELSAQENPRRAALLRQVVSRSKEKLVGVQFERLVELLTQDRLAAATSNQSELMADLKALLDLLMSEDRSKHLESEQARARAYLKEVNRLIKDQQGIHSQTQRGADANRLKERQQEVANRTGKLADRIQSESAEAAQEQGENPEEKPESGDAKSEDNKSDEATPGKESPSDSPAEGKESGENKSKEEQGDQPAGEGEQPAGEQPKTDQDAQPGEAKEQEPGSKQQPGNSPGEQPPQQGEQSGDPSQSPQGEQTPPPEGADSTQKRIAEAERRMREAQEKLDKAKREEAADKQEAALAELEKAKAELEKILRQLREEELARALARLEARFRKMLEAQVEIYEGTLRLDRVEPDRRGRGEEIESSRLSRAESKIVEEADKALALLREEGTAVAMPEAVAQVREDMRQITQRLAQFKVDAITQGVEQDVIAALEEMLAAIQQAQQELEQRQQQPQPPPGEPQEPPLVDQLAELRMIRSLQMRVNKRTEVYSKLIEGEQANQPELLQALQELAEREERIYRTTRDIVSGKNK